MRWRLGEIIEPFHTPYLDYRGQGRETKGKRRRKGENGERRGEKELGKGKWMEGRKVKRRGRREQGRGRFGSQHQLLGSPVGLKTARGIWGLREKFSASGNVWQPRGNRCRHCLASVHSSIVLSAMTLSDLEKSLGLWFWVYGRAWEFRVWNLGFRVQSLGWGSGLGCMSVCVMLCHGMSRK